MRRLKAKLASFIARGVFRIASSEMVIMVGNMMANTTLPAKQFYRQVKTS
jgi:hypothetical protein